MRIIKATALFLSQLPFLQSQMSNPTGSYPALTEENLLTDNGQTPPVPYRQDTDFSETLMSASIDPVSATISSGGESKAVQTRFNRARYESIIDEISLSEKKTKRCYKFLE